MRSGKGKAGAEQGGELEHGKAEALKVSRVRGASPNRHHRLRREPAQSSSTQSSMPTWRKLLDDAADDLDVRPTKPRTERTVAEALSFHRAQDRTHAREQRTLARLTGIGGGGEGTTDGRGAFVPPRLAGLLGSAGESEEVATAAGGRGRVTGVVRRPPGPPPPRSWTMQTALLRSGSKGATSTVKRRLPAEVDHFTTAHLAPPWAELHPVRAGRPPRLLLSALFVLLQQLSSAPSPQIRDSIASLPRHLRELAVWAVPNWLERGLRPEEVDALLWDARDWGEVDDDEPERSNGPNDRANGGEVVDDWDASSAGSSSPTTGKHLHDLASGWPTLYLPVTSLPLSTLRLLLSPLPPPASDRRFSSQLIVDNAVSPVTHLSLAFTHHPLERLLALPLPGHLRTLSLAGVRLVPEGYEHGPGVEPRVKAVLVRLARATPLLQVSPAPLRIPTSLTLRRSKRSLDNFSAPQYLDLSLTIPSVTPALLAGPDAVDWRVQWRALDTLVLYGLGPAFGENVRDARRRGRPSDSARELRQAIGVGQGRKWIEIIVD